jgi:hypothetical protein
MHEAIGLTGLTANHSHDQVNCSSHRIHSTMKGRAALLGIHKSSDPWPKMQRKKWCSGFWTLHKEEDWVFRHWRQHEVEGNKRKPQTKKEGLDKASERHWNCSWFYILLRALVTILCSTTLTSTVVYMLTLNPKLPWRGHSEITAGMRNSCDLKKKILFESCFHLFLVWWSWESHDYSFAP